MKRYAPLLLSVPLSVPLCLFAWLATPHLALASDASPSPSPYRLKLGSDRVAAPVAAPYLADPRYRLANAAGEASVAARPETAATVDLSARPYARQIDAAARDAGVDPVLVHALVRVESAYRADAQSAKGAVGLMQVLPQTAAQYGVADPSAVGDNLRAGTRHLRRLIDRYDARLELVLAAYNAGEGAVARYRDSVPPYAETRHYVPAVLAHYRADRPVTVASAARIERMDYLPGTRLDTQALVHVR